MKSPRGLHLHFDPVSGIAGDMTVAALVDAGVPPSVVSEAVAAIGVRGLRVRFESRRRGAYLARGFVVVEPRPSARPGRARQAKPAEPKHEHAHEHEHEHEHGHEHEHEHAHDHDDARAARDPNQHRDYADIRRLLKRARLDSDAKALAEDIFARLAEVEGALHGMPVERVTFHEVGAFDSIADVVGMAAAVAWLKPVFIGSSPPVLGSGRIRTAHGVVGVPAPATAELLRGVPVIADGRGELTTPTAAAFLAAVVDEFGPPPPMKITAIGYGAGTRELADRPNVLRAILGEPIGRVLPAAAESTILLETNIDDMSGQLIAVLFDALFAAGALDVWSTPIIMKKGRPAHQIAALVEPARFESVKHAFFLNSTTLGIRIIPVSRATLARSMAEVRTRFGVVRIKVAGPAGEPIDAAPELEDCRRLAAKAGVPVRRVWAEAAAAASLSVMAAPAPRALASRATPRAASAGRARSPRLAKGKRS